MAEITASLVRELRQQTGAGMMDCKKALEEAGGDKEKAMMILRQKGAAIADRKAARTAREGLVAAKISEDGRVGVMVEVNCETDFVARNEKFRELVGRLLDLAMEKSEGIEEAARGLVVGAVAEIGENIVFRRQVRYELRETGLIASYIHLGGKIGVLVEVGCEKPETVASEQFRAVAKDVTLQIAAANPLYLQRDEVPAEELEKEKQLYAQQVSNKPPQIIEKIVAGKLEKYFAQVCLLEQAYVRDNTLSVEEWLSVQARELGDNIRVRRYTRFQVGA